MEFITFDEIESRMIDFLNEDINTYSIGHGNLDEYWKFMLGNVTDITGYPYMGKTLFLMEILFNLSQKYGTRHLLHLPDSGKPEEVMAILIQKLTGKTFDKRYQNKITEQEIRDNIYWIDNKFKVLKYSKDKNNRIIRPTPKDFWDYSCEIDVNTASIDSWNYMHHDGTGTEYLAQTLSYRNELAELHKKHFFTIIHPKNRDITCFDAQGKLRAPDAYRLMGGSEWNNNGKNILAVHKDEKESQDYEIYFHKIKPRIVGKTGFEQMYYDLELQKFWTAESGKKVYAFGKTGEFETIKSDGGMNNWTEEQDKPLLDESNFNYSKEEIDKLK